MFPDLVDFAERLGARLPVPAHRRSAMLFPATTAVRRGGPRRRLYDLLPYLDGRCRQKKETILLLSRPVVADRSFRSEAALDALRRAAVHGVSPPSLLGGVVEECEGGGGRGRDMSDAVSASRRANGANSYSLVLYNYPSFGGAMAALFAWLYHAASRRPALFLPFSWVESLRVEDLRLPRLEKCYLLDFVGPDLFAVELSRFVPGVVAFDHRKSTLARVSQFGCCPENLELHIDVEKSSARAVYGYFSEKLSDELPEDESVSLLNDEVKFRVENTLMYIEDTDLRRWSIPDLKAFNIGLKEKHMVLNCLTNPYIFEQLVDIDPSDLIQKGNSYICSRQDAAKKVLGKGFKLRLGRGFYGECLCIRVDGHSNLSHEIGDELSKRSAAAGLRPIGAVVFMQRGNLKICLRTTDDATDTSEIAKAYGGGGRSKSSSFIIRMDEYNHWTPAHWT